MNIVRVITSKMMRQVKHVACMVKMKMHTHIWSYNSERKRSIGKPRKG
jgi:hypothetical protein